MFAFFAVNLFLALSFHIRQQFADSRSQLMPGFRRVQANDGSWSVWLTQPAPTPKGVPVVIMIQAETTFLQQAVIKALWSAR